MIRLLLLIILLITFSGCAFIGAGEIGEAVYTSRDQKLPTFRYGMLMPDQTTKHKSASDSTKFKLSDIESQWGKPVKTSTKGNQKELLYYNGFRWRGFILVALLPLPIAVPVDHKTILFYLTNDELDYWVVHDNHFCVSGAGFNFLPLNPDGKGFGFISRTDCQWHRDMDPRDDMACGLLFYDKCYPRGDMGKNIK